MEEFEPYLSHIEDFRHKEKIEEILSWIMNKYPQLIPKIAWNQPMFTNHGTFIIGFSMSKKHIAITPEIIGIKQFVNEIKASGYEHSTMIFRIKWDDSIDYVLLKNMIDFNLKDKANCTTFWRK